MPGARVGEIHAFRAGRGDEVDREFSGYQGAWTDKETSDG
jgi:hypothetical protein